MNETWKPVPGWEARYEVSDAGRVRSKDMRVAGRNGSTPLRRGRLLVQVPKQGRYLAVTLADGDRREQWLVHALVLLAFEGPCPTGLQCCHRDDDKANNFLSNLYYGTVSQNALDRGRNRAARRAPHSRAKLTPEQVAAVRASPASSAALARELGVTLHTIWSIRSGKTWKDF